MTKYLAPGKVESSDVKVPMSIVKPTLTLIGSYFAAWLLAYVAIMGLDFHYFPSYFSLAWRGGGEIPSAIQLAAMFIAILTTAVMITLPLVKHRRKKNQTGPKA